MNTVWREMKEAEREINLLWREMKRWNSKTAMISSPSSETNGDKE